MATGSAAPLSTPDRQWHIVGRWQEYEGEGRANLLRLIAVTAFYAIELAHHHGLRLGFFEMPAGGSTRRFHLAVTVLVVVWAMLCLGVFLARVQGYFPAILKFVSTGCDLVLLTSVLALGEGTKSPLVLGFFIIQMLACLRFQLPLIWFTTVGAVGCYVYLMGYARWAEESQRVPRYQQALVLVGLVISGVILGQVIRRVKHLAEDYARRLRERWRNAMSEHIAAGPPPLPPADVGRARHDDYGPHCLECGAKRITSAMAPCWLCGAIMPALDGGVAGGTVYGRDDKPVFIFVGVLVVLVVLGLALEAPGLLIVLALAATPALIRSVVVSQKSREAGRPLSAGQGFGVFLGALGATALVGAAAFVAFFATCFAVCLGMLAVDSRADQGMGILVVSVGAGLAPGIFVLVWLLNRLWKKRPT